MNNIKFINEEGKVVRARIVQRPHNGWFPGMTAKQAYTTARRLGLKHKRLKPL